MAVTVHSRAGGQAVECCLKLAVVELGTMMIGTMLEFARKVEANFGEVVLSHLKYIV